MKRQFLILLIAFTFVSGCILAQTPYDNYAPEQGGKEMLHLNESNFSIYNKNAKDSVRFIEFDQNTLTLTVFNADNSILKSIQIKPLASKFNTMDRLAEKYPWQSPYCYAACNPVMNIDINGDSAWSVKREWNESDQKGFAEYASKRLKEYEGKKVDCADLALNVIIDYASENGLSLQISTADGTSFDSNSDNYNSISDYKNGYKNDDGQIVGGVLPNVQARDISSNTFTLNKSDAQSGDMIIMSKPFDHIANYSQITPKRELTYGNLSEGSHAPVSTSHYDWSNSTVDGRGRPMVYNPNRRVVHRWKVLNF